MSNYGDVVNPLLIQAGKRLMEFYGNAGKVEYKTDKAYDAVTDLDIEIENFLKTELYKIYPNISFYGEESGGEIKGMCWIVDPIDGTAHFIRGMPFCSTMIALVDDEKVLFSSMYLFALDEMYTAELGKGSYCNGVAIKVSDRAYSHSYLNIETRRDSDQAIKSSDILIRDIGIVRTFTAGFEMAMVASGKMEGRIQISPFGKIYDFTPGSLLIQEAGGIVKNIGSNNFNYKNLDAIMANPILYKHLTEGDDALFPINH